MSQPGQGLPWFLALVVVDDVVVAAYTTEEKRILPRMPWIQTLEEDDPQLWRQETEAMSAWELELQWLLGNVRNAYNHSQGEWGLLGKWEGEIWRGKHHCSSGFSPYLGWTR